MDFFSNLTKKQTVGVFFGACAVILFLGAIFLRVFFLTFVEGHEIAYEFNMQTGAIKVLPRTGYFWVVPFSTAVYTIDGRPMQVRIEANGRVLNSKLVRFRKTPEAVMQFVQLHGIGDYNVNSSLTKSGTSSGDLADILKSYAYLHFDTGTYRSEEAENKAIEEEYKFLEVMLTTDATKPSSSKVEQNKTINVLPVPKDTLK